MAQSSHPLPSPTVQTDRQAAAAMAAYLRRRGWGGPAQVLLEVLRPFAFVGGQLLWMAQPTLALLWSRQTVGQMAELLEEPAALDALLGQLNLDEQD